MSLSLLRAQQPAASTNQPSLTAAVTGASEHRHRIAVRTGRYVQLPNPSRCTRDALCSGVLLGRLTFGEKLHSPRHRGEISEPSEDLHDSASGRGHLIHDSEARAVICRLPSINSAEGAAQ